MGLTGSITNDLTHRLKELITAAGKKYYTFVMGRLNEAKLCNFPEIDGALLFTPVHFVILSFFLLLFLSLSVSYSISLIVVLFSPSFLFFLFHGHFVDLLFLQFTV